MTVLADLTVAFEKDLQNYTKVPTVWSLFLTLSNFLFPPHRDRMGISKQELVAMLEEDELKDAILGNYRSLKRQ